MLSIIKKIKLSDMGERGIYDMLDNMFEGYLLDNNMDTKVKFDVDTYSEEVKWGEAFLASAPQDAIDFIKHLSTEFVCPYGNLRGRILFNYVFKGFFSMFPLGQIWILEIDQSWNDLIWATEKENKTTTGIDHFGVPPYGFTGLQEENFVAMALNVLSFCIYPVLTSEITIPASNYAICYLPDRGYRYSQLSENNSIYTHLLWKFHHVFDDEWTFDSGRGPKSAADPLVFDPQNLLEFFEWYIKTVDKCLCKLILLESKQRQQTTMTLNGLICDLFFSITSDMPFLSKTFFFNLVDKASNLLSESQKSETKTFQNILSEDFLLNELCKTIETIPGILKNALINDINWATEQLKLDGLSSELLRNLRNSQHGYKNSPSRWASLGNHTCEVNNDISLLALPIWLYIMDNI